jgi:hypothetical protein
MPEGGICEGCDRSEGGHPRAPAAAADDDGRETEVGVCSWVEPDLCSGCASNGAKKQVDDVPSVSGADAKREATKAKLEKGKG